MRKSYRTEADALVEDKLPSRDPFQLFKLWFQAANESGKLLEANAVCVTTCTKLVVIHFVKILTNNCMVSGQEFPRPGWCY